MWIKELKDGKFMVMPDLMTFETRALARNYMETKYYKYQTV